MENKVAICLSLDTNLPSIPTISTKEATVALESGNSTNFVNQAAIVWHDTRKKWVGDASKKSKRPPPEPIISWCTTYEDLLSGSQHFPQPIPLTEMVDFLVDIWHEEGLYD
ncbi:zinc finger protein [Carex rostrata]